MEVISRKDAISLGLNRYFTGKACSKGHATYRNTCDHSCVECSRIKSAKKQKRPEDIKRHQATQRAKYKENAELRKRAIANSARWVAENQEKATAYRRAYYQANKDKFAKENKANREARKKDPLWLEKERERCRLKAANNPEQKKSDSRNRRARIRKAEGRHTYSDVISLLEAQGYRCVYCGKCLRERYDVDHIMPIAKGGSNWPSNLQCLCPECNGRKWCKDPEEFAKEIAASLAISGEAGG